MSDKPTWMQDLPPQDRRRMRKIYEGKLEELQDVDDQVASVLDVLRRTGQLRRTWIFFVSDNGYLLGEHRLLHKSQPYEEAAGIPFAVRGPGVEPRSVDALVSQVDLMPTTLDMAGLDPDTGRDLDGRSMLEPLRSGDWSAWRRRLIVENTNLDWAMIREGSRAYVEHHGTREWELYDLAQRPPPAHEPARHRRHRPVQEDRRAVQVAGPRAACARGVGGAPVGVTRCVPTRSAPSAAAPRWPRRTGVATRR